MTAYARRGLLWWYATACQLRVELEMCPWWRPWRRRRLEASYRRAVRRADLARALVAGEDDLGPGLDSTLTAVLTDRPGILR